MELDELSVQARISRRKCWIVPGSFHELNVTSRWKADQEGGQKDESEQIATSPHGFASVSRRSISSKPIIAAVHGMAFGGGLEMVVNCDIVIAGASCKLGFPEVKRGVTIAQGGVTSV